MGHLLHNLLKRDAKDRIDFEAFFSHPFLAPPQPKSKPADEPKPEPAKAVSVPERATSATAAHASPGSGMLPPSPAITHGIMPSTSPHRNQTSATKMETSDCQPQKRQSPGSSPETDQEADFVMVPNSLAGDSSKNKNTGVSPLTARRIGGRPGSLPVINKAHNTEPIPVPTQRAAYEQVGQLYEEGQRKVRSSDSSRTFGGHRSRSVFSSYNSSNLDSSLASNIQKLFSEKIDYFAPVTPLKVSVLTGIIKLGLKTLLECVRLKTFGRYGLQQMQVDCHYLQLYLWRFVEDEALVHHLLDEVLGSALHRSLEQPPQLMEPSVVEVICDKGG